jgi:hypothetical protein
MQRAAVLISKKIQTPCCSCSCWLSNLSWSRPPAPFLIIAEPCGLWIGNGTNRGLQMTPRPSHRQIRSGTVVRLNVHHQVRTFINNPACGPAVNHQPLMVVVIGRAERYFSTQSLLEVSRWDTPYLFGGASHAACNLGPIAKPDFSPTHKLGGYLAPLASASGRGDPQEQFVRGHGSGKRKAS